MSEFEKCPIHNSPNANRLWLAISSNLENIGQAICEFVDNCLSNFRGNAANTNLVRMIRIVVRKLDDKVEVTVEDGGTGIQNLDNALTLAGTDAPDSPLNEHGFGLKHALSYMDGNDCSWEILTRTAADKALDRFVRIRPPYDFGNGVMQGTYEPGWEGHLGSTGTLIRFTCPLPVFETLAPDNATKLSFQQLVSILEEELRFTYATILKNREVSMELCWEDSNDSNHKLLEPLLPQWEDGTLTEPSHQLVDLGGGLLTVCCRHGAIRPDQTTQKYYSANMESSGAEIRINGRVVDSALMKAVWGRASHPVYNNFLAQIDLVSDDANTLPETKIAKNGFRAEKKKAKKMFQWIRTNVEIPRNSKSHERRLFESLAENKKRMGMLISTPEKYVFRKLGLSVRVDLFTSDGNSVAIYEGKVNCSHCIDIYQLRMYWDGCILDGIPVNEGILVAKTHSDEVLKLLQFVNTLTGPDGRNYNFRTSTWTEEGVCS